MSKKHNQYDNAFFYLSLSLSPSLSLSLPNAKAPGCLVWTSRNSEARRVNPKLCGCLSLSFYSLYISFAIYISFTLSFISLSLTHSLFISADLVCSLFLTFARFLSLTLSLYIQLLSLSLFIYPFSLSLSDSLSLALSPFSLSLKVPNAKAPGCLVQTSRNSEPEGSTVNCVGVSLSFL